MYWWYICIPALTTRSWRLDHLWLLQPQQRPTGRQPGQGVNTLQSYMGVFSNVYMGSIDMGHARSNYLEIRFTYIEYNIIVPQTLFLATISTFLLIWNTYLTSTKRMISLPLNSHQYHQARTIE